MEGEGDELGGSLGREGGRDGKEGSTKTALLFSSCLGSGLSGGEGEDGDLISLARGRENPTPTWGREKSLGGFLYCVHRATRTKDSPPTNKTEVAPVVSFFSAQEIRVRLP